MYQLKNVVKTFSGREGRKVQALDGVNLEIADGEMLAIVGSTGGGKTTLLQMLGALDTPTSGQVDFAGLDLSDASSSKLSKVRAENMGIVFQNFNLISTLTAQENVETALVPLGVSKVERQQRALQALENVGLGERAAHLPTELSGGQQQRVAIARALVKNPKVLLADEPTGALDVETRDSILELLTTHWKKDGLTLILVTHDPHVAQAAQRQIRIDKGKLRKQK